MNQVTARKRRTIDPDGKRAAILAAAQRLFAVQGYEHTVIAAVASEAGVAVGSVNRIFYSKSDLLLAAQRDFEQAFVAAMTAGWHVAGPVRHRFRSMFGALFDEMALRRNLMPLMALRAEQATALSQERDGDITRAAIRAFMREAIDEGIFRPVPIIETAEIAFGMVDAAMKAVFSSNDTGGANNYIRQLVEMLAASLEAEKIMVGPEGLEPPTKRL